MEPKHSTTSSIRRHVICVVVGFVVTVVCGDLLMSRVRLPQVFGSANESRRKWEMFEKCDPPPEVVFLGTSNAYFGISPDLIDAEVAERLGRPIRSLNLAAAGATLLTESLLARRIVESSHRPKIVYLGVGPRAADGTRREWLVAGLRALGGAEDLPIAASGDLALLWEATRATFLRSNHHFNDCSLIVERLATGAPLMPLLKIEYDDRGWAKWIGGARSQSPAPVMAMDVAPEAAGGQSFDPDGPNALGLRRAIRSLRSSGIVVRLFELPGASTASLRDQPSLNISYQRFLDSVLWDTALQILRPPSDLLTDQDFFDDTHPTARGAEKISRWLAADVVEVLRRPRPALARRQSSKP